MNKSIVIFFILLSFFACQKKKESQSHVVNLKCEHLNNPLGIDATNPRFSWQMESEENGTNQNAYQIIIGTDEHFLAEGNIWNSGKINSDANLVAYGGPALQPFTKYFWGVQLWDNHGSYAVSEVSTFETGLMKMSNWKGSWITDTRDVDLKPAPYFRKEFQTNKKVKSAKAYVVAAGLFELSINGHKIGDHKMDPTYTRFDRRNLYVTHDVTQALTEGKNAIGVLLGNGWYNHQSTAVWYFHEAPWRARPKFCMDLRIEYQNGSKIGRASCRERV